MNIKELNQFWAKETKKYFLDKVNICEKIGDEVIKDLVMFTLLDCLAQENSNYPKDNKKAFVNFVLKYKENYNFLGEIDGVSLFYQYESLLNGKFNLNYSSDYGIYSPKNAIEDGNITEVLSFLHDQISEKEYKKIFETQRYVDHLYKMRNKLVHEHSIIGTGLELTGVHKSEPCYISCNDGYNDYWLLGFPYEFIKNLFISCLENFLNDRSFQNLDAFENKFLSKKRQLVWLTRNI